MSIIILQDEQELKQKFIEVVVILRKMRKAQKIWHEQFGCAAKYEREKWETEADEFLESIEIMKPKDHNDQQLIIKSDQQVK